MSNHEVILKGFLRVLGTSSLTAVLFVFAPHSWMDGIHQWLGLGKLPESPVVGYLARSTSAFYAMLGGLFWAGPPFSSGWRFSASNGIRACRVGGGFWKGRLTASLAS